MGNKQFIELPVDAPLDTANPATSLAPGLLVEAVDVDHRYWGPRGGLTQQTWPYQSAASFPNRRVPIFDGNNGFGFSVHGGKNQFNLGQRWCLDLVIRPSGVAHSADTALPVFGVYYGSPGFYPIEVTLGGGGAASGDQRKVTVNVKTTSAPGTPNSVKTLVSTTQLDVGTTVDKTAHVRVYRDVGSLYLQINGTTEATSTTVGTDRHEDVVTYSAGTFIRLGGDSGIAGGNHLYAGRMLTAVLRNGAPTDPDKGLRDFGFSTDPSVRFALFGANYGDTNAAYDHSFYRNTIGWSGMTFESVTQPAPWASNPVQGATHFVDRRGKSWNAVMCGGTLFWARAQ